jgi:hypothetical protein
MYVALWIDDDDNRQEQECSRPPTAIGRPLHHHRMLTLPLQLQVSVHNVDSNKLNNECYVPSYAYTCSNHWILMEIDLEKSCLYIWDSMRKEQKEYQEMIDII